MSKWFAKNDAETIFDRLEARGRTWKVYVMEPMPVSFTGVIHYPRLKERLATHFVPFAEFEKDAAAGTLPDFSLIEPNMLTGHGDYYPAFGRSFSAAVDLAMDNPSSMLSGEAFLARVYAAYRSATSPDGANVWNTALLIGWDEPGAPMIMSRWGRSRRRTPPRRPAISDSPSTGPGTGYPLSSCRRGWSRGRCTTRSTGIPP